MFKNFIKVHVECLSFDPAPCKCAREHQSIMYIELNGVKSTVMSIVKFYHVTGTNCLETESWLNVNFSTSQSLVTRQNSTVFVLAFSPRLLLSCESEF